MQKVRYHSFKALTACKFEISDTISHHQKRDLFHHSFTLLIHYRLLNIYLGLAEGSAFFKYKFTFYTLLTNKNFFLKYRTFTFFSYIFQCILPIK